MRYRKKPIVIEAIQWTGKNYMQVNSFNIKCIKEKTGHQKFGFVYTGNLIIKTLEGDMIANVNDWIIKGVNGEFYPCKPDIFEKTYEKV